LDVVARTFRSVNIAAAGKRVRGRAVSVESGFFVRGEGLSRLVISPSLM